MKRFILAAIVPLVLFAFSAYGYHNGKGQDKWVWWTDDSIAGELNLSEEQKSRIGGISASYTPRLDEMRLGLDEKRKAFVGAIENPDSTKEEIMKAYDEMWTVKSKFKRTKLEMELDVRAALTSDQITKLNEVKQTRKKEMMQKHKKH